MYKVILTYNDLYKKIVPKEKIIDRIKMLDFESSLGNISYLIANRNKMDSIRKKAYICQKGILLSNILKIKILNENNCLYSLQGLLYLTKYIYAYCNSFGSRVSDKRDFLLDENELRKIIDLQLMLGDYMQIDIQDKALLHYNMKRFNMECNLKSLLSRTWYVYTKLALENGKLNINDFVFTDFNQKFIDKYNYSISEFLSVYVYLFCPFINKEESRNILIDPQHDFDKSSNPQKCREILNDIVCKANQFRKYAQSTIDNSWDYEILTKSPILQISSSIGTVISDLHLQENIIENLMKRITALYGENDNSFKQFLGHPFEVYVEELCEDAIRRSSNKYCLKREFNISTGIKSSEAYILKDNSMLIIEVKSKTMTRDKLFVECNSNNIYNKIKNQFIDPIQQIDNRCDDIKNSKKYSCLFKNINKIFAIAINFESCHLSVPEYHKYGIDGLSKNDKKGRKHIRTKEMQYFFCFSIEEFECICWLIERNYDIFDILERYYHYSNSIQLYEFLKMENISFEVVPIMVDKNFNNMIKNFYDYFQIEK